MNKSIIKDYTDSFRIPIAVLKEKSNLLIPEQLLGGDTYINQYYLKA